MNSKQFKTLNDIQTTICLNIRNICIANRVDMMKLSEDINISYEYLRHLVSLNGQKSISLYTIYKISKSLNVPIEKLFDKV